MSIHLHYLNAFKVSVLPLKITLAQQQQAQKKKIDDSSFRFHSARSFAPEVIFRPPHFRRSVSLHLHALQISSLPCFYGILYYNRPVWRRPFVRRWKFSMKTICRFRYDKMSFFRFCLILVLVGRQFKQKTPKTFWWSPRIFSRFNVKIGGARARMQFQPDKRALN